MDTVLLIILILLGLLVAMSVVNIATGGYIYGSIELVLVVGTTIAVVYSNKLLPFFK